MGSAVQIYLFTLSSNADDCAELDGCVDGPERNGKAANDTVLGSKGPITHIGEMWNMSFTGCAARGRQARSSGTRQMTEDAPHILVCEDNAALASVLRFNLERAGFRVTVARNGRIGWDAAQTTAFDLVVTDQQMPEMIGTELCGRLRQLSSYRNVPVIMLTAKGLELDLPRLRDELGITTTFPKPFSPTEVVGAVQHALAPVG